MCEDDREILISKITCYDIELEFVSDDVKFFCPPLVRLGAESGQLKFFFFFLSFGLNLSHSGSVNSPSHCLNSSNVQLVQIIFTAYLLWVIVQ